MKLIGPDTQIKNKRVLIMGLGTKDGGVGAAGWAVHRGAQVTVTDVEEAPVLTQSLKLLEGMPITYQLGGHDIEDFKKAEIVIRNPGIRRTHPLLQAAEDGGAIIESPVGILSELALKPYIGITGTKGKSYTTHLTQHMLHTAGRNAVAAGNNCVSPLRYINDADVLFVLELSSWELSEMRLHRRSPHIACWLNFFPDHLNYYDDMEQYWRDKRAITEHQTEKDILVLPYDDAALRAIGTKAERVFYTIGDNRTAHDGCSVRNGQIVLTWRGEESVVAHVDSLSPAVSAPHHLPLLLASVCCANALSAPVPAIKEALRSFAGLPHRFEAFAEWQNIRFINDSAATTPQSVILAVKAVSHTPLVLIFGGGGHKKLPYEILIENGISATDRIILFENDSASDRFLDLFRGSAPANVIVVPEMKDAVVEGISFLQKSGGGTLLLSPGCSGAPRYQDLFVRGDLFKKCVRNHICE
jgi:UDP-N-acetylmuramoylalanine--D-glutamate ligase